MFAPRAPAIDVVNSWTLLWCVRRAGGKRGIAGRVGPREKERRVESPTLRARGNRAGGEKMRCKQRWQNGCRAYICARGMHGKLLAMPSCFAKLLDINFPDFVKIKWMSSSYTKLLELL
jgi:hypothetical protein